MPGTTVTTVFASALYAASILFPTVFAQLPSTVASVGAFSYVGCYQELINTRALVDFAYVGDDLTVDLCASLCADYNFMGVEFGRECYCGNTVQPGSVPVSPFSDLTCLNPLYACSGNPLQLCGGARAYSLYARAGATVSEPTATASGIQYVLDSTIVPSSGLYNYIGCHNDPSASNRALQISANFQSQGMTVNACAAFCVGYRYVGLENGNECFCGDFLNAESTLTPCQDECYQCCAGGENERCGGYFRLSLYESAAPVIPLSAFTNAEVCTYNGEFTSTVVPVTTSGTVVSVTTTVPVSNRHTISPSPRPSSGACTYLGCYSDLPPFRTLVNRQLQIPGRNMTIEACITACVGAGYAYAGLEYGTECYCDNSIAVGSFRIELGDLSGLTCLDPLYRCEGDPIEYCGGSAAIDIFSCPAATITSTMSPTTRTYTLPSPTALSSTTSACSVAVRKRVVRI